jgi:hypothetical protein
MKPESQILTSTTKRVLTTAFILMAFLSLSGCITSKVLELRQARETRVKEATNFWSLTAVRSAHKMPGGEVFACIELRDSPSDEPQVYKINLSQSSRIGKTYAELMPVSYGRTEGPRSTEAQNDMAWYLYPLPEAQKGCGSATADSSLPVSMLKVETVQIHRDDKSRLPGMLASRDSNAAEEERILEVSFAPDDREATSSVAKDVMLVYLPASSSAEHSRAFGIAGAFEPGSEWVNPYDLLLLPAVAADAAVITTIILIYCGRGMV